MPLSPLPCPKSVLGPPPQGLSFRSGKVHVWEGVRLEGPRRWAAQLGSSELVEFGGACGKGQLEELVRPEPAVWGVGNLGRGNLLVHSAYSKVAFVGLEEAAASRERESGSIWDWNEDTA